MNTKFFGRGHRVFLVFALTVTLVITACIDENGSSIAPQESLAISPSSLSIAVGETQQFLATATFTDGTTEDATTQAAWTSSSQSVATIDSSGLATAVAVGNTTISAVMAEGSVIFGDETTLTVGLPALISIFIMPEAATLVRGDSLNFTAIGTYADDHTAEITTSLTWTSSDTAIAREDGYPGFFEGMATGDVTLTAVDPDTGVTGSTAVAVRALTGVAVTPDPATAAVGVDFLFTLTGTATNGATADLTMSLYTNWESSDPSVADANSGGRSTANAEGTTEITGCFHDSHADSYHCDSVLFTVTPP